MSEVQDAAKGFLEENMEVIENATESARASAADRNKKRGTLRALVLKAFRAGYDLATEEDEEDVNDDWEVAPTPEADDDDEEEDWDEAP